MPIFLSLKNIIFRIHKNVTVLNRDVVDTYTLSTL